MKIMIASDLHGSAHYARLASRALEREGADRLLFLGDLLYHGPRNDLPMEYSTRETAAILNALKEKIICVRGNCDSQVDQMMLGFPIMAQYALLEASGRIVYATHGHAFNMENPPPLQKGDVLLCGHTHVPAWKEFGDSNLYLNPGSLSIPKAGSESGYMVLEGDSFTWKNIDGKIYHRLRL